ncbi:hypothetical protein WJX82_000300 [Trebouxia sp. C0006]
MIPYQSRESLAVWLTLSSTGWQTFSPAVKHITLSSSSMAAVTAGVRQFTSSVQACHGFLLDLSDDVTMPDLLSLRRDQQLEHAKEYNSILAEPLGSRLRARGKSAKAAQGSSGNSIRPAWVQPCKCAPHPWRPLQWDHVNQLQLKAFESGSAEKHQARGHTNGMAWHDGLCSGAQHASRVQSNGQADEPKRSGSASPTVMKKWIRWEASENDHEAESGLFSRNRQLDKQPLQPAMQQPAPVHQSNGVRISEQAELGRGHTDAGLASRGPDMRFCLSSPQPAVGAGLWEEQTTRSWLREAGLAVLVPDERAALMDNPLRNGLLLCDLAGALEGRIVWGVNRKPRTLSSARGNIMAALGHLGMLTAQTCPTGLLHEVEHVLQGRQASIWGFLVQESGLYTSPQRSVSPQRSQRGYSPAKQRGDNACSSGGSDSYVRVVAVGPAVAKHQHRQQQQLTPADVEQEVAERMYARNKQGAGAHWSSRKAQKEQQMALSDQELVGWVRSKGLTEVSPGMLLEESFADGRLLCRLVSLLERRSISGVEWRAPSLAASRHNIAKAMSELKKRPSMSLQNLWQVTEVVKAEPGFVQALLNDMVTAYK